jgi:hypothetical protein
MAKLVKEDRAIPALVAGRPDDHEFHVPSSLDVENYNCFGVTGKDNRPICLKVLFSNGGVVLIHYGRISSPIRFDGKNKIVVEAPNLRLEITGANLIPLMDYLGEQRLAWIRSSQIGGETDAFMTGKGEPEIASIQVHPNNANQSKDSM